MTLEERVEQLESSYFHFRGCFEDSQQLERYCRLYSIGDFAFVKDLVYIASHNGWIASTIQQSDINITSEFNLPVVVYRGDPILVELGFGQYEENITISGDVYTDGWKLLFNTEEVETALHVANDPNRGYYTIIPAEDSASLPLGEYFVKYKVTIKLEEGEFIRRIKRKCFVLDSIESF